MAESLEAVVGEKLERGDLPGLAPVRTVRTEPEHGVVVGHHLRGYAFGAVREGLVVCGETHSGDLGAAHH